MQTLNKGIAMQGVTGLLFLTLMTGCAEWNSVPVVVERKFRSCGQQYGQKSNLVS